jgi:PAS domain S-box-containing protein
MSGRAKGLKIKGQQSLDPAVIAAAAGAIAAPFQHDFLKVVDLLPAAIYITDADGCITYYNEAAVELWGHRPPLGESHWCGSWRLYHLDGTPLPHDECPMALAIKENRPIRGMEAYAERPDGSRVRFRPFPTPLRDESGTLIGAVNMLLDVTDLRRTEQRLEENVSDLESAQSDLREQKRRLKILNRVARTISSDLDLERIVQTVTDVAAEAIGARFGAFFFNIGNGKADTYVLYALTGSPREAFSNLGVPRNAPLFEATFGTEGPVRSDDIRNDPRYKQAPLHLGVPVGQRPVVSYLAVPVRSKNGQVHGGLLFGHEEAGKFTADSEELVAAIASQAAVAIDNAQLLRNAQLDLVERGRARQDLWRLGAIIESSDDAIISKNLDGVITSWNGGAERLFGYTAEEAIGRPVTMLMAPDRVDEEPVIIARIRRGERIEHYDTVRRRKDGTPIDISLSISPIKDADGKIIGASKIARDISERKRAEQRQQLLVGEVKHRIKNLLATVQAIARQTLKGAPAEEREAFIARLMALANAQDLLTLERWNRAAVREVVDRALGPFEAKHNARFHTKGPQDVWVDASRASLLTMALHELATNAVKYGALSNSYGVVSLTWEVVGDEDAQSVRLTWRELGGPLVVPPERKGFGSFLIERALQGGGGGAKLNFNPNGLICSLDVAL